MENNIIPITEIGMGTQNQFAEWDENNPCFGCGNCCSDVRIELSEIPFIPREELFGELFPHVKNPEIPMDYKEVPDEPGVYFIRGKKRDFLVIKGDCPELQEDRSCGIHDQKRPRGCVTSGLESIKCELNRIQRKK